MNPVAEMVFTEAEVRKFAEKVERLCEFLIEKSTHSDDRNALINLKDEAADLLFAKITPGDIVVRGIAEVLK